MDKDAEQIRKAIRREDWTNPTTGIIQGNTQANLVIIPKKYAYDFLLFCARNPKSCPLLEVTDEGAFVPVKTAPNADLRTDIPKYRVYKNGEMIKEVTDISSYWSDDFVSFIIGCSFTFEKELIDSGVPIRHIEERLNVPMYRTNIPCEKAGQLSGPMVVSMRPMKPEDAIRAVQITSRFPSVHGAPIHIGNPATIGIDNLSRPDFGDTVTIQNDEVPVFWACGVTPQSIALHSNIEMMITHAPGHMLITDLKEKEQAVL